MASGLVYCRAIQADGQLAPLFADKHRFEELAETGTEFMRSDDIEKLRAIVGQLTYKWSKSLRWVAEYGHIENKSDGAKASQSDQGSIGMMLFF